MSALRGAGAGGADPWTPERGEVAAGGAPAPRMSPSADIDIEYIWGM
jgi:hypothetical protein